MRACDVHTHSLSHKEDEKLPFVITWMDVEDITLREINQMEKSKTCMISFIWNIKQKSNKLINIIKQKGSNQRERNVGR